MPRALTILHVDNSHPTQVWLKQTLGQDFTVVSVDNCTEAWKVLSETHVGLIIVEELLPDLRGSEFIQQLKGSGKHKHIPAIMTSGLDAEALLDHVFNVGFADFVPKPLKLFELKARIHRVLRQTAAALQYKHSILSLKEKAEKDALTQIFNREAFFEYSRREIAKCCRTDHTLSLLIIDIDNFKGLNDSYGHLAGDKVLREFSDVLVRNTRRYDMVGRYGGDEFVILLPHVTKDQALTVGEKILASMKAKDFMYKGQQLTVTPSIGIAAAEQLDKESLAQPDALEMLLEMADAALYQAKEAGRNCLALAKDS